MIIICILLGALVLFSAVLLVCFFKTFYSPKRKGSSPESIPLPNGKIYENYREILTSWAKEVRTLPSRDVEIKSHDNLTLRGKFYEYSPDAPIELMFHGYRGCAESDLSGGVIRCRALGHSTLIANNRASGESDGNVISFGVNESSDALLWIDYIIKNINPRAKIILTGISMGGATVILTAAKPLPSNVVGVLADCPYTSSEEIIKKIVREMKLPPRLVLPFIKVSARLFGKFRLDDADCVKAVKRCTLPIIFFHGDSDDFVPCEMSRTLFEACTSEKKLVIVPLAGHGLSFPVNPELYLDELRAFFEPVLAKK